MPAGHTEIAGPTTMQVEGCDFPLMGACKAMSGMSAACSHLGPKAKEQPGTAAPGLHQTHL